jgi:hypothetical protein
MAIAAEAFELLGDRDDVALLEIGRAGLAHENAKTASVPFGNLFDEFLAAKAVRNPKYVKELKLTRERFRRFDKVLAADVQPKALSEILDRMPPAACNANMRYSPSAVTSRQRSSCFRLAQQLPGGFLLLDQRRRRNAGWQRFTPGGTGEV